jgi:hypothetical protein
MSFGLVQKDAAFSNAGIQRSINNSTSTEDLNIKELNITELNATNITLSSIGSLTVGNTSIENDRITVGGSIFDSTEIVGNSITGRIGIVGGNVPMIPESVNVSGGYFIDGNPVAQNITFQVDSLPPPTERSRAFVNDSSVQALGNFGSVVVGGGGDFVPVYGNGVNWILG